MSSQEEQVNFFLSTLFGQIVVHLTVCGIQIFMWLYMMSFYAEASIETQRRRLPYVSASLVILGLSCASSVLAAVAVYHIVFEAAPGPENVEAVVMLLSKYQDKFLTLASLLGDWSMRIGDAVLLYRCYIVWFERRWVVALPTCVFIASTAINIRSYIPFSFLDRKLNIADVALVVTLNVLLTSLISFRLIQAQRRLASALPNVDHHKVYLGIVGILVESAAPVAIFGLALAISLGFRNKTLPGFKAAAVLRILFANAAVLAPQLIIFRVNTGTSWVGKTDTGAMFSRPIEFKGSPQSGSDEESGVEVSEH